MDTETTAQLEQALRAQAAACRALAHQLDKQAEKLQPPDSIFVSVPEPAPEPAPEPGTQQPLHVVYPGISKHRLHPEAGNPCEVAFARAWLEDLRGQPTRLDWLMHPGGMRPTHASLPHEHTTAATIIQWLGSPVGQCFLVDVVNSCPPLKATLWRALLVPEKATP